MLGSLITHLGSEGFKIYETFEFTIAADASKIGSVLDKFTDHLGVSLVTA